MIQLLVVDLDGTLTYGDRKLDIAGVEAIRRAEVSGLPVVLATGNVLAFAEAAATLLGCSGPLIAEDGGIVFDRGSGREYVLGDRMEADRGLEALERAFGPIQQTRGSSMRLTGLTLKRSIGVEDISLVLKREGLDLVAIDSSFAIHLRSPEVNKGNALRKVANIRKIPLAQIAAVGDGLNDIEMLQAAGLSFAVANANEMVKQICTYVTAGSHGRGVAEVVERILTSRG